MIKFRFIMVAVASALLLSLAARAQHGAVLRKLRAKYDKVFGLDDGRAMVSCDGRCGYADTLGKIVIPLRYDNAARFRGDRAVVAMGRSMHFKYALIDPSGREVTPFEWDNLGNVNDGVAVGMKRTAEGGRQYALIDTAGKVLPLPFDRCNDFSEGLAVVGTGTWESKEAPAMPGLRNMPPRETFTGRYGYITPDGQLAIPVQFDEARPFDRSGLAPVAMQGKYYPKWGFIDRSGEQVIPCIYYSVDNFSRGLAVVSKVTGPQRIAYGYIDAAGNEVVPCELDEATGFRFPNTWVGKKHGDRMWYTLMNRKGEAMLSYLVCELQDGGKYGQAAAAVPDESGRLRFGILDNDGKVILPFEYDEITIFSEWDEEHDRWQEAAMAAKDGASYSFDISKK